MSKARLVQKILLIIRKGLSQWFLIFRECCSMFNSYCFSFSLHVLFLIYLWRVYKCIVNFSSAMLSLERFFLCNILTDYFHVYFVLAFFVCLLICNSWFCDFLLSIRLKVHILILVSFTYLLTFIVIAALRFCVRLNYCEIPSLPNYNIIHYILS